eukprot:g12710.t1
MQISFVNPHFEDSSDSGGGGFLGIVRGIQARTRKSANAEEEKEETESTQPKRKLLIKKDEAAELERDRKEAAKRTLELMEVGHRWAQRNRIRQLFHL